MSDTIGLVVIIGLLLGSCTVMAGDFSHWPASLVAVALIILLKIANDRFQVLRWPMEFLLASAVTMIIVNLTRLYFIEPMF